MRRVHVLVTAGAVLPAIVLTACSGKPNDLRHYRETETSTAVSTQAPGPAAPAPPPGGASPVATPSPSLERGALSAADLADEEVRENGSPQRVVQDVLPDCQIPLRAERPASAGYRTAWTYPTGAVLRQYVAAYDGRASEVVAAIRRGLDCGRYQADGVEYRVDPPFEPAGLSGVDAQLGWCSRGSKQSVCTVLVAEGRLLTALTVSAPAESRARGAVTRLAPRAVTALQRM